jgi:hypothetical protein
MSYVTYSVRFSVAACQFLVKIDRAKLAFAFAIQLCKGLFFQKTGKKTL